jgi:cytochrome c oxidase subunit I+III
MSVDAPEAEPAAQSSLDESAVKARLERTWLEPSGIWGFLTTVDPKRIGRRYIVTAFVFFALGGVLALLMRLQLAHAQNTFISADRYSQIFSMHGTTMMFLFAVPVMEAIGIFIVPIMAGARSIAYPRLTAFSYWIYLAGGVMIYIAFALNIGPETGWFSYVPLAGPEYSPGKRTDFWAQMVTFTEVAGLSVSVALIATILKMRAVGMTLARMPLFLWAQLVTSFMVCLAMPAVMLATTFLICDRELGTHFYNQAEGSDPLLWQHLFWFFGHPEVYIIFLPALGMVSEIVRTFTRRTIFGYPLMVLALIATAFMAFGLWVHHMFATGLPSLGDSFYTGASMAIALPTGVQIFCWIATMWDGRIRFATPMLYVIGFFVVFVLGGLTGVMLASVPLDTQVHDTYFVVAHFHYVLIGGAVFPLLGAVHYWYPKIIGRMMSEALGKLSFWLVLIGFNVTFFPMHLLGVMGMPRRVYTYSSQMGWDTLNLVATCGAFVLALGVLVFVVNAVASLRNGAVASANPWDAPSLEWATTSPPPDYNFAFAPVASSREPLWNERETLPVMTGLALDSREVLLTSVGEAAPEVREASPEPSIWPLLTALAATFLFIGSIFDEWFVIWGAIPVTIALIGWFWPKPSHRDEVKQELERDNAPASLIEEATR